MRLRASFRIVQVTVSRSQSAKSCGRVISRVSIHLIWWALITWCIRRLRRCIIGRRRNRITRVEQWANWVGVWVTYIIGKRCDKFGSSGNIIFEWFVGQRRCFWQHCRSVWSRPLERVSSSVPGKQTQSSQMRDHSSVSSHSKQHSQIALTRHYAQTLKCSTLRTDRLECATRHMRRH